MDPAVVALLTLLGTASLIDLRARRIPNLLVGFGLCLGFALAWSSRGQAGLWFALAGAATGFALCLPLFLLRALGAGDTKLMMVVGSFVGVDDTMVIGMLALVVSGILGLAGSVAGRRLGRMFANLKAAVLALASRDLELASGIAQETTYRVPFAVPVLVGAVVWLFYFY